MVDWRKPEDYEYTLGLSLHQWAWEFLRRNPAYRAGFKELMDIGEGLRGKKVGEAASLPVKIFENPFYRRFGLSAAIDPDTPAPSAKVNWAGPPIPFVVNKWSEDEVPEGVPWPGWPSTIAIAFYVQWPIASQLKIAEQIVEKAAKHAAANGVPTIDPGKFRVRKEQYPLYVRLLDAQMSEATKADMGRFLFPGHRAPTRSARKTLQTAQQLSERDYWRLLLLPPDDKP